MKNFLSTLAIQQLEGGTYTIDTVLKAIKQMFPFMEEVEYKQENS